MSRSPAAQWLTVLRVLALVAIAVSVALYLDYTSAEPAFCGADSGCGAVRRSGFGYIILSPTFFIPVPVLGLAGYGLLLGLTAAPRSALKRQLLLAASLLAGLGGAVFLVLQAVVIGQFCKWCVVVDLTAILGVPVALAYFVFGRREPTGSEETHRPWAWAALLAVAIVGPLLWPRLRPTPPVPAPIRALYVEGKVNVIEFADFQCPYCRRFHGTLKEVMAAYPKERVHFRRLNKPLASHPHAMTLAKTYVCGRQQGKGEAMADRLFSVTPAVSALAEGKLDAQALGLDGKRFRACMDSPATVKTIEEEAAVIEAAGFQGLPTTYIQGKTILGAQPQAVVRDAFDRALEGSGSPAVPGPLYVALLLALGGGVLWLGRRGPEAAPPKGDSSEPAGPAGDDGEGA